MLRLLLLLVLGLVLVSGVRDSWAITEHEISDEEKQDIETLSDEEAFDKYFSLYNDIEPIKFQASPEAKARERKARMKIFSSNLHEIKNHNKKFKRGETKFEMKINSFTAMSAKERRNFLGLSDDISSEYLINDTSVKLGSSNVAYPSQLQWNRKKWVTAVKNQGSCGSCWTYPAAALVEFAYQASTGYQRQFSEQELLDCTYESQAGRDGCGGGFYTSCWDWIIKHRHLPFTSDYSYNGRDGYCRYQKNRNRLPGILELEGYKHVGKTENEIIAALQKMPLAVAFHVEDQFFSVGSGEYEGCFNQQSINHAVTLTGYGPTFWEIKNSWGVDWGNRGYARFKRGYGDICGLLSAAYYIEWKDLDSSDGKNPNDENWDDIDDDEDGDEGDDGDDDSEAVEEKIDLRSASAQLSSSTESGAASQTIDGNKDTMCHSNWEKAWLKVKLPKQEKISKVIIYNINHACCYDRLKNAAVEVYNDGQRVGTCGTVNFRTGRTLQDQTYVVNCNNLKGNTIKLTLAEVGYLHIYELEVFRTVGGGGPVSCEDESEHCPTWAEKYCADAKYKEYMLTNCKKSCGCCSDNDQHKNNCPSWTASGYCHTGSYIEFMNIHCKLSCKTCLPEGSNDDNNDKDDNDGCAGGLIRCKYDNICKHEHMCHH